MLALIILGGSIAIGCWARFHELSRHFTHTDDIGVAATILYRDSVDINRVRQTIYDTERRSYNGALPRALRWLDSRKVLETVVRAFEPIWALFVVPLQWTYAPLQFFFTQAVIDLDQDYVSILFWGRLPSAIFAAGSLFTFAIVARRIFAKDWLFVALLPVAVLSFSWQNVIYAKQMENYSLGVLAVIALMYAMASYASHTFSRRVLWMLAGAICVGILAHYQVLFFVPAALLVAIICARTEITYPKWRVTADVIRHCALPICIVVAPLYMIFLSHRKGAGITWNAGPNHEFVFAWNTSSELFGNWLQFLRFVSDAGLEAVKAMVAFGTLEGPAVNVLTWAVLVLAAIGIAGLAIERDSQRRAVAMFALFALATHLVAVALGILALSPTRHSMLLLPFLLVLCAQGSMCMMAMTRRVTHGATLRVSAALVLLAACGWMAGTFLASVPAITAERRDLFQELEIEKRIAASGARIIIADGNTFNPYLMRSLRDRVAVYSDRFGWIRRENIDVEAPVAFTSYIEPISEERRGILLRKALDVAGNGRQGASLPRVRTYKEIFRLEKKTEVEVCFSKRAPNGSNGVYFYIMKPRVKADER